MQKRIVFCFLIIVVLMQSAYAYKINIQAASNILETPIVKYAVEDVQQLLKNAGVETVILNQTMIAEVQIVLPNIEKEKLP